jgi:predicted histone-like DNA-binding protein
MANRIIGAIPYSKGLRLKNPSEKDSEKEIVAFNQERETVDLAMLAKHIKEHGSSFSTGTIYGCLTDMVECVVELLKAGYGVLLNGLGKFGVSLIVDGVNMDEADDFSAANITGVRPTFNADAELKMALNTNPEFEYVGTRAAQQQAKKEESQRVANGQTTESIPSGSNQGGSGSGDPGDVTP